MNKELPAMKTINIWKLVDQNEANGSNGVLCRWVYSIKKSGDEKCLMIRRVFPLLVNIQHKQH